MNRHLVLVAGAALAACAPATPPDTVVLTGDGGIEFPALVQAAGFGEGDMAGYHLVVWNDGRAVDHALFRAAVTDLQVIDALESVGARPGDALDIDTWDRRHDAGSEAPDRIIVGSAVRIEILVPGADQPLALSDILVDEGERGFDMRFGGHRDNIARWRSGCVACLYSCPGSKVGNASYTVRDFVSGASHFSVRPGVLPPDGTAVTVRVLLLER